MYNEKCAFVQMFEPIVYLTNRNWYGRLAALNRWCLKSILKNYFIFYFQTTFEKYCVKVLSK